MSMLALPPWIQLKIPVLAFWYIPRRSLYSSWHIRDALLIPLAPSLSRVHPPNHIPQTFRRFAHGGAFAGCECRSSSQSVEASAFGLW